MTGWPIPPGGYGVILADPAWLHDMWSEAGQDRSPSAHYDTMTTDQICALFHTLNLEWICGPNSVFVLWSTWPHMARGDAHRVMREFKFEPKTGGAWTKVTKAGKPHMGTGFIYRGASEPWLLGTRGNPEIRNKRTMNAILSRRGRHSEKPGQMQDDIERLFYGPYLELFARTARPGWTCWGNQVGILDGPAPARRSFKRQPAGPGPLLVGMGGL